MQLQHFLGELSHSDSNVRQNTICILGLVDETRALPALRLRFTIEPDPEVKQAIDWAGRRITAAQQAGHTVLDEIFRTFKINAEIDNLEDPTEAALLQKMENQLDSDLRRMQMKAGTKTAIMSAAAGAMAGGAMGAARNALSSMAGGFSADSKAPEMGKKRIPAQHPADTNVTVWLRRLQEPGTSNREKALLEITQLNNPAALPALAEVYRRESSELIKNAIQRTIKSLYLNAEYWYLSQDGTIDQEFQRRAEARGVKPTLALPAPQSEKRATQETSQAEISRILDQAQTNRLKRKRR